MLLKMCVAFCVYCASPAVRNFLPIFCARFRYRNGVDARDVCLRGRGRGRDAGCDYREARSSAIEGMASTKAKDQGGWARWLQRRTKEPEGENIRAITNRPISLSLSLSLFLSSSFFVSRLFYVHVFPLPTPRFCSPCTSPFSMPPLLLPLFFSFCSSSPPFCPVFCLFRPSHRPPHSPFSFISPTLLSS